MRRPFPPWAWADGTDVGDSVRVSLSPGGKETILVEGPVTADEIGAGVQITCTTPAWPFAAAR